jgi:PKHD-type hydroxylase
MTSEDEMEGVFLVKDVLSRKLRHQILSKLDDSVFVDGKKTASGIAADVKSNEQVDLKKVPGMAEEIAGIIRENGEFQYRAMPKLFSSLLINRYRAGMAYGSHTDNAVMAGGGRSDLSFTLVLSDLESYEGGELCMETPFGEQALRITGGDMLVYPSGGLHRVAAVRSGQRIALVGWVQSRVRDAAKRQILLDLDRSRQTYLKKVGHDRAADLLAKSAANLRRMWDEG